MAARGGTRLTAMRRGSSAGASPQSMAGPLASPCPGACGCRRRACRSCWRSWAPATSARRPLRSRSTSATARTVTAGAAAPSAAGAPPRACRSRGSARLRRPCRPRWRQPRRRSRCRWRARHWPACTWPSPARPWRPWPRQLRAVKPGRSSCSLRTGSSRGSASAMRWARSRGSHAAPRTRRAGAPGASAASSAGRKRPCGSWRPARRPRPPRARRTPRACSATAGRRPCLALRRRPRLGASSSRTSSSRRERRRRWRAGPSQPWRRWGRRRPARRPAPCRQTCWPASRTSTRR
mmetsp:Transcript_31182/g.99486  ORF Transcript_31182/g.99486 Transcript_31182/m.99486 type:complete len:294 (+) Transcript_31182:508-1389(+)